VRQSSKALQKFNKQAYGPSFGSFILQYVAARQEKDRQSDNFSIKYEWAILRIGMELRRRGRNCIAVGDLR
jgi:hypothetical protein